MTKEGLPVGEGVVEDETLGRVAGEGDGAGLGRCFEEDLQLDDGEILCLIDGEVLVGDGRGLGSA